MREDPIEEVMKFYKANRMVKSLLLTTALSVVFSYGQTSSSLEQIFEYDLPVAQQYPVSAYKRCKVASLQVDGIVYYQTYLYANQGTKVMIASAAITRGILSPTSFSYEDDDFDYQNGEVVSLKVKTEYVLDPKSHRVLRSELKATDSNGKVIYDYVCGETPVS